MSRIKNIVVMIAIVFSSNAFASQPMKSVNVVGKLPQGVSVINNRVIVKPGFKATQISNNKVSIISRRNNNTTGSFECGCSAGGGGCKVVIQGNSITCVEGGGCTKGICEMSTTIPSMGVIMH